MRAPFALPVRAQWIAADFNGRVHYTVVDANGRYLARSYSKDEADYIAAALNAYSPAQSSSAKPSGWTRTFEIVMPPEMAAGLMGYNDKVTIAVKYGVGEEDEEYTFEDHMRRSIAEWFDGAKVTPMTDGLVGDPNTPV